MSDFAQFPRPVKSCRAEYGSGKTHLIVDACQLSDDLYEVITMRPRGEEVELVRVATEAEARAVYAQMVRQRRRSRAHVPRDAPPCRRAEISRRGRTRYTDRGGWRRVQL